MTPTSVAIVIYLIGGWWMAFAVMFAKCEGQGDHQGTEKRLANASRKRPVLFWLFQILAAVVLGPVTPLLMVYACGQAWRERRHWRQLHRKHRPALFEPKPVDELPSGACEHFEHMVPQLEALGFSREGTYLYKPKPFAIHCATMLSLDGETIADVSYLDGEAAYSFTSVLSDGQVLETACCPSVGSMEHINDLCRFHADMVERGGEFDHPDVLYHRHRQTLAELGGRYENHPLSFTLAQVTHVMKYANDLLGELKYDLGQLEGPRPAAVLPVEAEHAASGDCHVPEFDDVTPS